MPAKDQINSSLSTSGLSGPIHVLVVDDLRVNYLLVKAMLGKFNAHVSFCDSGFKAVEHIKNGSKTDIVLMDFNMPGIDGTETTERIKAIDPSIPVISLSTFTDSPSFDKNGSVYDGYISKPVNPELLIEEITRILLNR